MTSGVKQAMKLAFTLYSWFVINLLPNLGWAQNYNPVHIFQKATGEGGFDYFAQNNDFSPYQIQIEFTELKNLQPDSKMPFYQVIYPGEPQKLFTLNPEKGQSTSFKSKYQLALGDPRANIEEDFVYWLPFNDGRSYVLVQGANGAFTHQGKNAYDFEMKEGTEVCASRGGVVVLIKEDSKIGGPDVSFMKDGNRITILHEDGSFADYVHLKYQGSLVEPGDRVKAGQVIGYSGNTGWSSQPHLHFQVYRAIKFGIQTLPVKFQISPQKVGSLQEMESYRGYHKP